MSCPYFEIQKSEDFDNIAEIIKADKEVKHFVRRRRYTPFDLSNNSIKSAFDKNVRHSQSGYFKACSIYLSELSKYCPKSNTACGYIFKYA